MPFTRSLLGGPKAKVVLIYTHFPTLPFGWVIPHHEDPFAQPLSIPLVFSFKRQGTPPPERQQASERDRERESEPESEREREPESERESESESEPGSEREGAREGESKGARGGEGVRDRVRE